jgi:hypothetical protein
MKTRLIIVLTALCAITWLNAQAIEDSQKSIDPGKTDLVVLDSVLAKPGQNVEISLRVLIDDTTSFNNKPWYGVGSFCLPFLYNSNVIQIDSVRFKNTLLKWDEKFTNKKIDTGFVSFAGIYTLTGAEKPPLVSPKEPLEIVKLYLKIKADAKPGNYPFEITKDPLQGEMYFGSIDGYHSWKPKYVVGKVVVTK